MKSKNIAFYVLILVFILLSVVSLNNRYKWGTWLPGFDPTRINFKDRRYYPSGIEPAKLGSELKLINKSFYWNRNLLVLKEDYQKIDVQHKYELYMILYLEGSDGQYLRYTLSGGP